MLGEFGPDSPVPVASGIDAAMDEMPRDGRQDDRVPAHHLRGCRSRRQAGEAPGVSCQHGPVSPEAGEVVCELTRDSGQIRRNDGGSRHRARGARGRGRASGDHLRGKFSGHGVNRSAAWCRS